MTSAARAERRREAAADPHAQIADAVRLLCGGVVEIRALSGRDTIDSAYYDVSTDVGLSALLRDVSAIDGKRTGIYFTLNALDPRVLHRAENRMRMSTRSETTSDKDVTRRRYFPLDFDVRRPAGVSSSDAEHDEAIACAQRTADWLATTCDFPRNAIILGDTGNGACALVRIDEPNDSEGKTTALVKRALGAAALYADTELIHVDPAVTNAARIWRLPGTLACKGDPQGSVPHRRARILVAPSTMTVAPRSALERLAALIPNEPKRPNGGRATARFPIEDFLADHLAVLRSARPWLDGATTWAVVCPFDTSHNRGEAVVIQFASGALSFRCHHASCADKHWADVRERFAPAGTSQDDGRSTETTETPHETAPLDLWGAAGLTGRATLDLDMLPPIIAAMAADEAERLGVDAAMLALPALVVCAAAIDDAHRIQPRRADTGWTESARLWLALITPPGGRKSPALARVVAPLRRKEQAWIDADQGARTRYDIELRRYRKLVDDYVRRGTGAPPDEPPRPRLRRRIVSDATLEALGEILVDSGTAVLALYDELVSWLTSHDCYRDRGGGRDRALWLSLYDGGPQVIDRVRRGHMTVPRFSACVLGAIQPGPLRRLVGRITDDGLVQRIIPVWTNDPTEGVDRAPDPAAGAAYDALIAQLASLPAPSLPYLLSEDAHAERELVATTARHVMALPTTSDAMRGALAKWDGLYARLLLIYHLVECSDAPSLVSGDTARRVARLMVLYLLPQTARLYAELVGDGHSQHAKWIAGYILARGLDHISARDVGRAYRELRDDTAAISAAMETLTLASWVTPANDHRPGSPLRRWRVSPAVHRTFAVRAVKEREERAAKRQLIAEAAAALGMKADDEDEA